MKRISNSIKILDFLMKKIPTNQMNTVTSVKEISETTGIDMASVFRAINHLKKNQIIGKCQNVWTDYKCYMDSNKRELRSVRFFLNISKAQELLDKVYEKGGKHVPYHVEEFDKTIVLVEVYKSHTTSSVYVKYYNKITWEYVTVRFSDHPPSLYINREEYVTTREEIINRLHLNVA